MPSDPPLVVQNLSFRYRTREALALDNVSFTLQPGQVMLIAGTSGCGKTTLMRCINGLIPNTYTGEMSVLIGFSVLLLVGSFLITTFLKVGEFWVPAGWLSLF